MYPNRERERERDRYVSIIMYACMYVYVVVCISLSLSVFVYVLIDFFTNLCSHVCLHLATCMHEKPFIAMKLHRLDR